MNPAATVLSTAGGVGVIGLALLDAFVTFFSHVERGALSHTLVRAMWSTCHRLPGTGALRLAGPVSVLIDAPMDVKRHERTVWVRLVGR
jgi:hypothetical protein